MQQEGAGQGASFKQLLGGPLLYQSVEGVSQGSAKQAISAVGADVRQVQQQLIDRRKVIRVPGQGKATSAKQSYSVFGHDKIFDNSISQHVHT